MTTTDPLPPESAQAIRECDICGVLTRPDEHVCAMAAIRDHIDALTRELETATAEREKRTTAEKEVASLLSRLSEAERDRDEARQQVSDERIAPREMCGQVFESSLRGALICTKPNGHWRDPDIMVRAHSNGVSMWPAYEDRAPASSLQETPD